MNAGAKAIGLKLCPGLFKIFGKQDLVSQVTCSELKVAQIFASGSKEKENSVIKMQCPVCCK